MTAEQRLLDSTIRNMVMLERLKAGEVKKFAPFLIQIDQSIRERLSGDELTDFTRARLDRLLKEVDAVLTGIFAGYTDQLQLDLMDIAQSQASFEAKLLTNTLPLGVSLDVAVPALQTLKTAAFKNPLSIKGNGGGKLLDSFIKDWSAAEVEKISGAIRQGWFEGQTNAEIVRQIRGTKALAYSDGILSTTERNAATVVRTSVQHVANQARNEVAKANDDIVKGVKFLSTLDNRTSQICRSLSGQVFPVDSGPRPPMHPNCRSSIILLTKYSDIFSKGATQSSMHGQVSADLTYYQWLHTQSAAFQDLAIGPTRGKLFRDGGISAEKFSELQLGTNFKPLTLEMMKELEPEVFAKAGL
jgi:SPP1 gp7 family putative phage head morphogenesis protein